VEKVDVLGVKFHRLTPAQAVEAGKKLLEGDTASYAVTPNPEIVFEARKNRAYCDILNSADLTVSDGIGIVKAAAILHRPALTKVAGIELGESLIAHCARVGYGVYFLGSKPGIAEKAAENLSAKYPGLVVSGTHDGYFDAAEPIAPQIRATGAKMVLVCLGFPKQENWIDENKDKTGASLLLGLGGSLDVFAGAVSRAPATWVKLGLEWLYRLLKEPKRIKRMWKLPFFLVLAMWYRILGK